MKKKKKLMSILGLYFEIILSYLVFITIKNKTSINAMDTLNEKHNYIFKLDMKVILFFTKKWNQILLIL